MDWLHVQTRASLAASAQGPDLAIWQLAWKSGKRLCKVSSLGHHLMSIQPLMIVSHSIKWYVTLQCVFHYLLDCFPILCAHLCAQTFGMSSQCSCQSPFQSQALYVSRCIPPFLSVRVVLELVQIGYDWIRIVLRLFQVGSKWIRIV